MALIMCHAVPSFSFLLLWHENGVTDKWNSLYFYVSSSVYVWLLCSQCFLPPCWASELFSYALSFFTPSPYSLSLMRCQLLHWECTHTDTLTHAYSTCIGIYIVAPWVGLCSTSLRTGTNSCLIVDVKPLKMCLRDGVETCALSNPTPRESWKLRM